MPEAVPNKPPHLFYSSVELPRVLQELSLLLPAHTCLRRDRGGDGQPVMTLPGFGGGDGSTAILRRYLRYWGYDARAWEAGRNANPEGMKSFADMRDHLHKTLDLLADRLDRIHAERRQTVSLVGWSLGGIIARLLACRRPELVRQIISLGTPYGDFRSTVIYPVMRRINGGDSEQADLNAWLELIGEPLEHIPQTVIYSKSDGFVAPHIATMPRSEWVENIQVVSSHVGFAFNPMVLFLVADRLLPPVKQWQPYRPKGLARLLYKVA